ncbi:MAG TPA: phospholipase D-like domain-containing protein [Steroidobacteraceae bacterium]|nr:phospholipase D-like domain-containing protein [Steroidobacteraceae bacterium]
MGSVRALALLLALSLGLAACVQLPVVNERQLQQEASGPDAIRVYGVHGPLSHREARRVLARVASVSPDANALDRHLAVEQLVAESPLYTGNSVKVLRDGSQTFPAMFSAIAAARHFVDLEYYTFQDVQSGGRSLGDLLVTKSRSGVHVRVMYDAVGSLGTPAPFLARLRTAGVKLVQYNPLNPLRATASPNDRDHRKILVVDDEVAIVGGVNLSTTYESAPHILTSDASKPRKAGGSPAAHPVWHDLDLEIRGPAVLPLARLFRQHWREQKGPALGPDFDPPQRPQGKEIVRVIGSSPARLATRYYATVLTAIRTAQSSIWMTAAYFVPTHQELTALKNAARRGVDVRILLASHTDVPEVLAIQRSYYGQLLRAGVKVYERRTGIVHSKAMVIDGVWSLVGSSNFDQRSVLFNDEVDVVVLGISTAEQIQRDMLSDMAHARRIDWRFVHSQGLWRHLEAVFWRLWRPLF